MRVLLKLKANFDWWDISTVSKFFKWNFLDICEKLILRETASFHTNSLLTILMFFLCWICRKRLWLKTLTFHASFFCIRVFSSKKIINLIKVMKWKRCVCLRSAKIKSEIQQKKKKEIQKKAIFWND